MQGNPSYSRTAGIIKITHDHYGRPRRASCLSCKDLDQENSGSATKKSVVLVWISQREGVILLEETMVAYPFPAWQTLCYPLSSHPQPKTQDN